MKLLLHTCCGPCFLGVWDELGSHPEVETTLYYDNPNIYPEAEYVRRLEGLRAAAKDTKVDLVELAYESKYYDCHIGENLLFPSRCTTCYRMRLERAAMYAASNGFDALSTTLFVSPYQQHEVLMGIADEVAKNAGLKLYYTDWRPYFREGQQIAKAMSLYRQRYCGCKLSLAESNQAR